ncbi:inclusion membrane domain protein, partial [Chlamydia psittaci 84-8471/1]
SSLYCRKCTGNLEDYCITCLRKKTSSSRLCLTSPVGFL